MRSLTKIEDFFFKVFLVNRQTGARKYRGTAFSVAPNGLLTCRHVVDISYDRAIEYLAIEDTNGSLAEVKSIRFSLTDGKSLDIAYIDNPVGKKRNYFRLSQPNAVVIGDQVFSFGFYEQSEKITHAYFSGSIVNLFKNELSKWGTYASITLPYPTIEGMSGSPVLLKSDHSELPLIVGMLVGSKNSRVVASEVLEYKDKEKTIHETINRIVEFGVAYHVATIAEFLKEIK